MTAENKLKEFLKAMASVGASDLHIRAGSRPIFRVDGKLRTVKSLPSLEAEETREIAEVMFNAREKEKFEKRKEVDLSYSMGSLARFRVNVFRQRGFVNIVLRLVPTQIQGFQELNLPESLEKIASYERGIILVTGITGCGKTTTQAAMINYMNNNFSRHIITIEDPIEYVHSDKKSIISQRELGIDTLSYTEALTHVVRQDPDVILIGEMRDVETMSAAITAAQTGHLVLSTTHTIDAMQTINRIVDIFPPYQQDQVRIQFADTLRAVISQRILPKKEGGVVPAVELLVVTGLIRNLIEENRFSEVKEQMEKGDYYGMRTFNQALEELYSSGLVSLEEAKKAATHPEDLMLKIRGIQSDSGAEA
ncbi:MAG: type IV pilus twitching motility protein PilT [Elusimicrobiota bacterium]